MEKISDGFKGERAIVTPYSIRELQSENQFTSALFVTHIGFYPYAKNHFKERSEGTSENILIYCVEGRGSIVLNEKTFSLIKDQAFIIPAKHAHSYAAEMVQPWSIHWIHFRGNSVSLYSSIMGRIINLGDSRIDNRLYLFEEIYQNLEMGYELENLEYTTCCFQRLMGSMKYLNQYSRMSNLEILDAVQKSIVYMKKNLTNKLTLEDIAKYVGYSSSYFSTLFSEKTSFSPIDYYNQLKIQKACSLLQFSDMKIKEIAYYLGYYDPFHFSKAFNLEMEISPREYRLRYQPKR